MRMGTSRLENFDPEHGDVLVLPQAQAEQLFELGAEIGGPILWELLAWFLCKSEGVMEDVRDNVFLRGLVDNQKLYARKTFDRLSQQKANAESRWRRDEHATACHGMPLDAEAARKRESGREAKSFSSSFAGFCAFRGRRLRRRPRRILSFSALPRAEEGGREPSRYMRVYADGAR